MISESFSPFFIVYDFFSEKQDDNQNLEKYLYNIVRNNLIKTHDMKTQDTIMDVNSDLTIWEMTVINNVKKEEK